MEPVSSNKTTIILDNAVGGNYSIEHQVAIHKWLSDLDVCHQYFYVLSTSHQRDLAIEFENEDDALFFKLSWGGDVSQ